MKTAFEEIMEEMRREQEEQASHTEFFHLYDEERMQDEQGGIS